MPRRAQSGGTREGLPALRTTT